MEQKSDRERRADGGGGGGGGVFFFHFSSFLNVYLLFKCRFIA